MKLPARRDHTFYALIAGNVVVLLLIGVFVLRPLFGMLTRHTAEITRTKAEIASLGKKTVDLQKLRDTFPAYEAAYAPIIANIPKTRDVAGYQTELEELAALTKINLLSVDTSSTVEKPVTAGNTTGNATARSTQPTTSTEPSTVVQTVPAVTQVSGFPAVPVKIDITGSYAAILDFVNRLETMDRFTRVTSLNLQRAGNQGVIKATLDLQTLYFK